MNIAKSSSLSGPKSTADTNSVSDSDCDTKSSMDDTASGSGQASAARLDLAAGGGVASPRSADPDDAGGSAESQRGDDCSDSEKSDSDDDLEDLARRSGMVLDNEDFSQATTPRTRYIAACIQSQLNPRASLVIRKDNTKVLNLQHMGIGDKMGRLLADSITGYPALEAINISDNNFTDQALAPILLAASLIPNLVELNISQNIIGPVSSKALSDYILSPQCSLKRLVIKSADVDDFEAAIFLAALKTNCSVIEIDLSNNLLGSAENLNTVMPDVVTAPEALADLLCSPACHLQTLNLSWNMIRMAGADDLCRSLAINKSVTHLDLSFNAIGQSGLILGEALTNNRSIKNLILSTNSLDSKAAFTILCGIIENKTLKNVVLDGNPIGEAGAHCLMLLPPIIGSRIKLSMRNCNVNIKDPTPFFSFDHICTTDFRLNLANPLERAIAVLLVHIVAGHHSYVFSRFDLDSGNGRIEAVPLTPFWCDDRRLHFSAEEKEYAQSLSNILLACNNETESYKLFNMIDRDGNRTLSMDEFAELLHLLGKSHDEMKLREIFEMYDSDHSGTIGKDEFKVFLKRSHAEIDRLHHDVMYSPAFQSAAAPEQVYSPPKSGKLVITVKDNVVSKSIYRTLSLHDCASLEELLDCGCDRAPLIMMAIKDAKLRLPEALAFFKQMKTEISAQKCFELILPQLANEGDARMFLLKSLEGDRKSVLKHQRRFGMYTKPIMGSENSFYCLDLSKPFSRFCLKKLYEMGAHRSQVLIKNSKLNNYIVDIGQKGKFQACSAFRNETLNGKRYSICPDNVDNIPTSGCLCFDYSGSKRIELDTIVSTDKRVVMALVSCFLLSKCRAEAALRKLLRYSSMCDRSLSGDGMTMYEPDYERGSAVGDAQQAFYDHLPSRYGQYSAAFNKEEFTPPTEPPPKISLSMSFDDSFINYRRRTLTRPTQRKEAPAKDIALTLNGDLNLDLDDLSSPGSMGIVKNTQEEKEQAADTFRSMKFVMKKEEWDFSLQFANILASPQVSDNAKAARLLDIIEDTFSKIYIFAKHLALLLELFKHVGSVKRTDFFGSYRVDAFVALFERVVDKHNIELAIRMLDPYEAGCVYCRLGWLTLHNPMKPEGSYTLNLAEAEERAVVKILCVLATEEPGDNWIRCNFTWDRSSPHLPGWELTKLWLSDEGLPKKGILLVQYYSGDGVGKNGCAPVIPCRRSLLSMVFVSEDDMIPLAELEHRWIDIEASQAKHTVLETQSSALLLTGSWLSYFYPPPRIVPVAIAEKQASGSKNKPSKSPKPTGSRK